MKRALIIIIIGLLMESVYGQTLVDNMPKYLTSDYLMQTDTIDMFAGYVTYTDSSFSYYEDSICIERGHVQGDVVISTAMYCAPYVIDYPDSTIEVYPSCNHISYECSRCRNWVSEPEPEVRTVIWRRK